MAAFSVHVEFQKESKGIIYNTMLTRHPDEPKLEHTPYTAVEGYVYLK